MEDSLAVAIIEEIFRLTKLQLRILEILDDNDYDIIGTTDFTDILLERDFDLLLSAIILDQVPGRITLSCRKYSEHPKIVNLDKVNNQIIRTENVFGSCYIDEEIKKMNKILEDAKNKV